jgi:hypothetical protein
LAGGNFRLLFGDRGGITGSQAEREDSNAKSGSERTKKRSHIVPLREASPTNELIAN